MNKYEKPEILVINLEQEDVVRTSPGDTGVNPGPDWE